MRMSPFIQGYIIGIIEGEGYVGISRHKAHSKYKGKVYSYKSFVYRPRIDITGTCKEFIYFINKTFPKTRVDTCREKNSKHKKRHILRFLGVSAVLDLLNNLPLDKFIMALKMLCIKDYVF